MYNRRIKSSVVDIRVWSKLAVAAGVLALVAGCAEVDSEDGLVANSLDLPVDSSLVLFCADAGIAAEPCILDDPNNPYAITPVNDDTKFELSNAAPSAKARFYLWATAQAMSPRGENQFFVGQALQAVAEANRR